MSALPDFAGLRRLLSLHQYTEFLDGFDGVYDSMDHADRTLLRVLAGDGLVQCLHRDEPPEAGIASRFFQLLAAGKVELPDNFTSQLADRSHPAERGEAPD